MQTSGKQRLAAGIFGVCGHFVVYMHTLIGKLTRAMQTTQEQFQAMIAGLEDTGLSLPQIALTVGCSRVHMWRLASGEVQSPRYDLAIKLVNLAEHRGVPAVIK